MDITEVPLDVRLELSDPLYTDHTHGRKGTYSAGCRGPLCKKNERDTKRREYARRIWQNEGREVQVRKSRVERNRDELLERCQAWHEASVGAAA